MMNNHLKIRTLTERFLEGETTLEEEQLLFNVYKNHDVPEDLLSLRPLFIGLEGISLKHEYVSEKKKTNSKRHKWIAIVASLLLLLVGGGALIWHQQQNECVAFIYGKKCTDRQIVMQELQRNISEITIDENDVEEQLKDMFNI